MVQADHYGTYAEQVVGVSRHNYFNAGMLLINSKMDAIRPVSTFVPVYLVNPTDDVLAKYQKANGVDATDETSLTDALVYSRRLYAQIERYYHEYMPGFENAKLVATAGLMGIRESRRIVGEYVLNMDDYLARRSFDDEIGRYCYNVDIHPTSRNREAFEAFKKVFEGKRYKPGESYGVPFRVLLPKGVDNLLVAGRCISTDRPMQSSTRVIPGCYITGQAAGVAAGLCVKDGLMPHDTNVSAVRRELVKMKMYLPDV